jgi:ribonuclease HI
VVVSPSGLYINLSIRLEFACTNNQVEYESLLHGVEFLRLGGKGRKHVWRLLFDRATN